MTSIKDYVKKSLEGVENLENGDDNKPDVEPNADKQLFEGVCPFCESPEFSIFVKVAPIGRAFIHSCPHCMKFWCITPEPESEEISFFELSVAEVDALFGDV